VSRSLRQRRNVWERERDCVDRRRADIHKGGREGVEGGEEKTSVEVKPHCYLNSREIRLPNSGKARGVETLQLRE
jgi:hypothetical protein